MARKTKIKIEDLVAEQEESKPLEKDPKTKVEKIIVRNRPALKCPQCNLITGNLNTIQCRRCAYRF